MKLSNIRLLVDDFPACFRFYRDVMDLSPTYGRENEAYADFDAGGAAIALFDRSLMADALGRRAADSGSAGGDAVLVFSVDDVDAEFLRLRRAGAPVIDEPVDRTGWGIRCAHFQDPAGNLIEIFTSLAVEERNVG